MIAVTSIWAVTLRHIYLLRRDFNFLLMAFYWPTLDILIWGFLGSWIQKFQMAQLPNYEAVALLGILLWQIVGRGCNIITIAFMEELWRENVVNLFSLPLRIAEWMCGALLFNILMMVLTTIFAFLAIAMLYNVSLWYLLSTFLIFAPPLFFSSIWIGFTCLQIVVTMGKRGAELGFVVAWLLLPFSGAYYPVEVLPGWAQTVSLCTPMSYVFQGMRGYVMYGQNPTSYLIKGYVLSILYAIFAIVMFVYCFNRSKRKGLARLAD